MVSFAVSHFRHSASPRICLLYTSSTPVHAESKQYWTESAERVGIIEKVMNDGSIGSTFNEGYMKVEDETAYCIDINTDFKNGYKTRACLLYTSNFGISEQKSQYPLNS